MSSKARAGVRQFSRTLDRGDSPTTGVMQVASHPPRSYERVHPVPVGSAMRAVMRVAPLLGYHTVKQMSSEHPRGGGAPSAQGASPATWPVATPLIEVSQRWRMCAGRPSRSSSGVEPVTLLRQSHGAVAPMQRMQKNCSLVTTFPWPRQVGC